MKTVPTDSIYRQQVDECSKVLKKGGIVLIPTDTIWGLGCDASNQTAIEKMKQIKSRPLDKSFISLVSSEGMLQNMVKEVPEMAWDLIELSETPLTIVYPKASERYNYLSAEDGSIAIRMVKSGFVNNVIHHLGKPIISTSANESGKPSPVSYNEIDSSLMSRSDFVADKSLVSVIGRPSSVIKLGLNGEISILRK